MAADVLRRYTLLGTWAVTNDGSVAAIMKHQKGCALLAYLIVTQLTQRREAVADLLWDTVSTTQSLANLRGLLTRIRKLAPELTITRQTVAFNPADSVGVDLYDLQTALASDDLTVVDDGLRRYGGDLLDGFYLVDAPRFNEWLVLARQQLRNQVLDSYRRVQRQYEESHAWAQGVDAARRWLTLDRLDEEPLRRLMVGLARQGKRDKALQQFEDSRNLHLAQLGIDLDPETSDLAARIRSSTVAAPSHRATPHETQATRHFWDETPAITSFFGRSAELAQLSNWLTEGETPIVAICGIGGVGKTSLASQIVRANGNAFETIAWRSLLNAPRFEELVPDLIQTLSGPQLPEVPGTIEKQLSLLLAALRERRCLLVLDNVETIMSEDQAGAFRAGYEPYRRLLQFTAHQEHQSRLVITSREVPAAFNRVGGPQSRVRVLTLTGLERDAGQEMLRAHGLQLGTAVADTLVARYSGNPLALNLIAQVIHEFYDGDVVAFVDSDTAIFDDIRSVLDQQYDRLSSLEREILIWLAVARDPLSLRGLQSALVEPVRQGRLLEALRTLQRRSLLEKTPSGFTLQNVVIEYLTDRLIEHAVHEWRSGQLQIIRRHALQQATAKSYVRRIQARLIIQPIAAQLATDPGLDALEERFSHLLEQLRTAGKSASHYAAGNMLNLLRQLGQDVTGYDFTNLSVWQAILEDVYLTDVNFAGADLRDTIFADTFSVVYAVAFSANGQLLAAGSADGRVRVWNSVTGEPLHLLQAHSETVSALAFSPDGHTLASACTNGEVKLWRHIEAPGSRRADYGSTSSAPTMTTLVRHRSDVHAVAFSPDGTLLATGSASGIVTLWTVRSGLVQHLLRGHSDNVKSVAFSPDGRYLASGSRDQTVRVWDLHAQSAQDGGPSLDSTNGTASRALRGHTGWVNGIAYAPDGNTLVSGSEDRTIRLWDLRHLTHSNVDEDRPPDDDVPVHVVGAHGAGVQSVAFSPDGLMLASGSNDQTIRLWDVPTEQVADILHGHTSWVRCVQFSPDGNRLASGSWDHSVRLWRRADGKELRQFRGFSSPVFSVAFSPDGSTIASGGADKRARLWEAPSTALSSTPGEDQRAARHTLIGHTDWVWQVAFSRDGTRLASGGMDRIVHIWDVVTGQQLMALKGHEDGVQSLAFSPDGRTLATGSLDSAILLWDLEFGRIRAKLEGHTGWCLGLDFSPDGRLLVSASADKTVRLWDSTQLTSPTRTISSRVLYEHEDGVQQARFSPDGNYIASGSWDRTVIIWDVARGAICHTLHGHVDLVRPVSFSPDSQLLLSGSNDGTICLWNVRSGEKRRVLKGHDGEVYSAEFSPNGRYIVSASHDETFKSWDVQSGTCLWTQPMPQLYAGMNISGATGLTLAQKTILTELGAIG